MCVCVCMYVCVYVCVCVCVCGGKRGGDGRPLMMGKWNNSPFLNYAPVPLNKGFRSRLSAQMYELAYK